MSHFRNGCELVEYGSQDKPIPKRKYCVFCGSRRLRFSLNAVFCERCKWWFKVIDECETGD